MWRAFHHGLISQRYRIFAGEFFLTLLWLVLRYHRFQEYNAVPDRFQSRGRLLFFRQRPEKSPGQSHSFRPPARSCNRTYRELNAYSSANLLSVHQTVWVNNRSFGSVPVLLNSGSLGNRQRKMAEGSIVRGIGRYDHHHRRVRSYSQYYERFQAYAAPAPVLPDDRLVFGILPDSETRHGKLASSD